jgi:DNA modification methylase
LARDLILSWSNPTDIVIDPFAGSGTTPLMAELTNRGSISIEINPTYIQQIKSGFGVVPYLFEKVSGTAGNSKVR